MKYLIQKDLYALYNEENIISTLERINLDYEIVSIINNDIDFKSIDKNIFCFGSVKMAHISKKYNFNPGSFYNENHDFEVYSKFYGKYMLNHDAIIMKFGDSIPDNLKLFFARPTGDNKYFSGQHFLNSSWKEFVDNSIKNEKSSLTKDTVVMISQLKEIQAEYRFFVVKGKVITGSRYKIGEKVIYSGQVDDRLYEFAQKMVDISDSGCFRNRYM